VTDLAIGGPPSRLDPIRTDAAAPREVIAALGREATRGRDEVSDARIGHTIDDVPSLPVRRHKPAPL